MPSDLEMLLQSMHSERSELKHQLKNRKLKNQERFFLHERINAINHRLAAAYLLLPPTAVEQGPVGSFIKLATTPAKAGWFLILSMVGLMAVYPRYCLWRHKKYAYTAAQIDFRRCWWRAQFPMNTPSAAQRLGIRFFQRNGKK